MWNIKCFVILVNTRVTGFVSKEPEKSILKRYQESTTNIVWKIPILGASHVVRKIYSQKLEAWVVRLGTGSRVNVPGNPVEIIIRRSLVTITPSILLIFS